MTTQGVRTCDELGVCKGLTPPCKGCTLPPAYRRGVSDWPFAPGAIECHRRQHGKHLVRWMVRALCLAALAAVAVGLVKGGAL